MLVSRDPKTIARIATIAGCQNSSTGRLCSAGEVFDSSVVGGAERRQQKSAEGHLFKKGGERDPEGEEDPCGPGCLEELVDGRVCGARHEHAIDHGYEEAENRCADEARSALESGCAVPVNSFKEGPVPEDGKDDEASDKSDDVLCGLATEGITVIGGSLRDAGDAEEVIVQGERHKHHGADKTEDSKQAE